MKKASTLEPTVGGPTMNWPKLFSSAAVALPVPPSVKTIPAQNSPVGIVKKPPGLVLETVKRPPLTAGNVMGLRLICVIKVVGAPEVGSD
jgi:hypothetical protein